MLSAARDGVLITVKVVPRSSRSAIAGTRGDALLVHLNAPPVDGAANAELIAVIADVLDVPRRAVSITLGERARRKTVHVRGVSPDEVRSKLERAR
jgi:uncharacterized protein (TIGR00251 family)